MYNGRTLAKENLLEIYKKKQIKKPSENWAFEGIHRGVITRRMGYVKR